MRCIEINYNNTDYNEVTWPDEVIVKINGIKITEYYSLLKSSKVKKRKDGSIIIT